MEKEEHNEFSKGEILHNISQYCVIVIHIFTIFKNCEIVPVTISQHNRIFFQAHFATLNKVPCFDDVLRDPSTGQSSADSDSN